MIKAQNSLGTCRTPQALTGQNAPGMWQLQVTSPVDGHAPDDNPSGTNNT